MTTDAHAPAGHVPELPKTVTGKIQCVHLRAGGTSASGAGEGSPPVR